MLSLILLSHHLYLDFLSSGFLIFLFLQYTDLYIPTSTYSLKRPLTAMSSGCNTPVHWHPPVLKEGMDIRIVGLNGAYSRYCSSSKNIVCS